MKSIALATVLCGVQVYAQSSAAASCSSTLTASHAAPSVADGYVARLVANGLTSPRGIKFDNSGALLVVEQGVGVSALDIVEDGAGCFDSSGRRLVIDEPALNHGIETSPDGSLLYASSGETLWSWEYSAASRSNTSAPRALVTGMAGSDHTSRTLRLSRWAPGLMLINRGSNSNLDVEAADITTGHSQIKAFNVTNATEAYDFNTDGVLMGWGLRNDVGIDEEPTTGRIYSVENSADEVTRLDQDIHQNNPAEKLNFLGYLNGTSSANQGRNFGYPDCFDAWRPSEIPSFTGAVGEQFAIGTPNGTLNDTTCAAANRQAPRLTFQAHMAPLDILFNDQGTAAWISFHGSWNRDSPVGYDLRVVAFADGEPVADSTSTTAAVPVMSNADLSACPDACFRPVGLAWDARGRLFMSSDSTGEIYAILRTDGEATNSTGSDASGSIPSATTGSAPAATTTSSHAVAGVGGVSGLLAMLAATVALVAS